MKANASRFVVFTLLMLSLVCAGAGARGADIDFVNGTWTHPSGTSTGWNSTQTTGTTTLPGGVTATVTVTFAGTASPAALNFQYIDESYYQGFAFQQNSAGAANSGSLNNYMRINIQFSSKVTLTNLVINDVDVYEVVQVEGWTNAIGAPSAGIPATYTFGNNLEPYTLGGIAGVSTKASSSGNTTLDPQSNVGIGFGSDIHGISIYYSKKTSGASPVITIGLEGNIQVTPASKRLHYTFSFVNDGTEPVTVNFFNSLPAGLKWDTEEVPQFSGSLTGGIPAYNDGNQTVAISGLRLPPGSSSLTLSTKETGVKGIIVNDAEITPSEPSGPAKTASATIDLPE